MHTDPVCGMQVEKNVAGKSEHNGQQFYFCSAQCKQQFDRNPKQFAKNTA
jgi:Cu+-exporting ATPase